MALWARNVNAFENAFKPVPYRQWEAFKGDHNVLTNKVHHRNRNHKCNNIPCRKPLRRSPWEDDRHENLNSFFGYIVPVPVLSQTKCIGQRFPFASSDICVPTKNRKFSDCNLILPRSRDTSAARGRKEEKPHKKKRNKREILKKAEPAESPPPEKVPIRKKQNDLPIKHDPPKKASTVNKIIALKSEQKTKEKRNAPKPKIVAPFKISPPSSKPSITAEPSQSKPNVIPKKCHSKSKPKDIQPEIIPSKKKESSKISASVKNPESIIILLESSPKPKPKRRCKPKVIPPAKTESPEALAIPEIVTKPKCRPKVPPPSKPLETKPENTVPPKIKCKPKVVPPPPSKPSEKKPENTPPPKIKSKLKVVPIPNSKKSSDPSSISSSSESKYPEAEKAFEKLRRIKPPVVLFYGQTVIGVEIAREHYFQTYAAKFKAVPIKLDEKIEEWSHIPLPETRPDILEQNKLDKRWQEDQNRRCLIEHAIEISMRLTSDPTSTLNMKDTLDLIKDAMLDSPHLPGGFIIDGFPASMEEGLFYEPYFWEFVVGIQFLNASGERHSGETESTPPKYFRREFEYKEKNIGMIAAHFGSKSIRVYGDEKWGEGDDNYMNNMLDLYLQRPGNVPFSKTRHRIPEGDNTAKESFMGVIAPSISQINALKEEMVNKNKSKTNKTKKNKK